MGNPAAEAYWARFTRERNLADGRSSSPPSAIALPWRMSFLRWFFPVAKRATASLVRDYRARQPPVPDGR